MTTAVPITATPVRAAPRDPGRDPGRNPTAGLARRVMVLAAASFTLGFLGYIAFNGLAARTQAFAAAPAAALQPADAKAAPAAIPTSDPWNLPKAI